MPGAGLTIPLPGGDLYDIQTQAHPPCGAGIHRQKPLTRQYTGIPACTDVQNRAALTQALLDGLKGIALGKAGSSPEHTFFIGLAYLGGVDVEVDPGKALSLITDAAEAGLPEAMEKLVSIYRNGMGTDRLPETAILWQQRLVSHWQDRCAQEQSEAAARILFRQLWTLADLQKERAKQDAAKETLLKMEVLCQAVESRFDFRRELFVSDAFLGEFCLSSGDSSSAESYFQNCLSLAEQRYTEAFTEKSCLDLALAYEKAGSFFYQLRKPLQAQDAYERCLSVTKQAVDCFDTPGARRQMRVICSKLGDTARQLADFPLAKAYYEKALGFATELTDETRSPDAQEGLFAVLHKLGELALETKDIPEATACFEKGHRIAQKLAEETDRVSARHCLLASWDNLGSLAMNAANLPLAKSHYLEGNAIARRLAEETSTRQALDDLFISLKNLAGVSQTAGDLPAARAYYLEALAIAKQLAEETGTPRSRELLCDCCYRLGSIAMAQGSLGEAKDIYVKCLTVAEALAEESDNLRTRRYLFASYFTLAAIAKTEKDLPSARAYYQKSCSIAEKTLQIRKYAQGYDDLASACYNLARLSEDRAEATALYQKAYDLWHMLSQKHPQDARYAKNCRIAKGYL